MKIFKYGPLEPREVTTIRMPTGTILLFGRSGGLHVWAKASGETADRTFFVAATGQDIPDGFKKHITSCIEDSAFGPLVWHLFERFPWESP